MFREKRLQRSPGRPLSRPTTPERRDDRRQLSSPVGGSSSFFTRPGSRNVTPERRILRFRRPSSTGQKSVDTPVKDQIGIETRSARSYSISPARSRGSGTLVTSNNRSSRFQFRELRDEESIRRFSRSPARRKELEKAANRALQSNQSNGSVSEATSISASSRATTSQSPPRRRGYSDYGTTSRDTRLPLPPSAPYNIEKDKEIVTLRKELRELQEHLMKALESEQLLEKRADKKQRAAESATVAMEDLQKTVQVQAEQIKFYEACLKERNTEVQQLNQSLRQTEAKCAKIELDLESHDLKFSIYDDYRRLMDRERLDGKNDGDSDDDGSRFGDNDFERAVRSNQENAYIGVLSKLGQLERLFEQEKADSAKKYAALKNEKEEALEEIARLKAIPNDAHESVANSNVSANEDGSSALKSVIGSISSTGVTVPPAEVPARNEASSLPSQTIELLEKRIKILESDNRKASKQIQGLSQELERSRGIQNDMTVFANENELSILRLEKDALSKRISALETEIGFTSGKIDDKTRTRRYRALEKNLNDYIAEIMSLEDRLKAKENIISSLKEKNLAAKFKTESFDLLPPKQAAAPTPTIVAHRETHTAASMPRSRLNQKIEELKRKAQMAGQGQEDGSRIAMLRKRLDELSTFNEEAPSAAGTSDSNTSGDNQSEQHHTI